MSNVHMCVVPGPLRRMQLSNAYTLRRVYSALSHCLTTPPGPCPTVSLPHLATVPLSRYASWPLPHCLTTPPGHCPTVSLPHLATASLSHYPIDDWCRSLKMYF